APPAVLLELQPIGVRATILGRRVVPPLTRRARERDDVAHRPYSEISVTTPAPTVRPPSRIANRSSFSIAIGTISSIAIVTLSPGITISTPWGNVHTPVTSVVRK